jgi:hypothetical protein
MIRLSQNLKYKLTILKSNTSVAYRFFATSGFDAITTRELRTFRALYNSREFLNKLQPNGNSLTPSTAFVKDASASETLRTFFIPSSVTG